MPWHMVLPFPCMFLNVRDYFIAVAVINMRYTDLYGNTYLRVWMYLYFSNPDYKSVRFWANNWLS